ncbi:MAG: hypothetical protein ABIR03_01705 [Ginsengibacter sp.]
MQKTIGTGVDSQGFYWKLDDFIILGFMLFPTAFLSNLVLKKVKKIEIRILICLAILFAFVLICMDLAVGIFKILGFSGS